MTSQYWMVIACEWLWLATIFVAADSLTSLEAVLTLIRLDWAILSDALLMLCWKDCAAEEASLWEFDCLADEFPLPLEREYPPDSPSIPANPEPTPPKAPAPATPQVEAS